MPLDGILDLPTAEVLAPALQDARWKALYGGRGAMKSHFFAESLVERCLLKRDTRWMCVREHQNSLRNSSKQLIEDKVRRFELGSIFHPTREDVRISGGGVIFFQGMKNHTADSIKSFEGLDGAWFEEAQACSAISLEKLRPTLRKEGSEGWFSWNPALPTDPVDAFFRGNDGKPYLKPPNSIIIRCSYKDNPWFPSVLRDDMEYDKRRDADRYKHIWLGDYDLKSDARVFRNWRIGEPEEFTANPDRFYLGADWGFSIDPSVLVRIYVKGRTLYIDYEAYRVGCEIDHTPFLFGGVTDPKLQALNREAFEAIKDKVSWTGIPNAVDWPITADSARPETIKYMQKHGFPRMRSAVKGPNSVQEGIEFLRSYDIVVHPRCVYTIDELTMYSYMVDPKTMEVLPKLADKKNHVIDACRYAVEPLRRARIGMH